MKKGENTGQKDNQTTEKVTAQEVETRPSKRERKGSAGKRALKIALCMICGLAVIVGMAAVGMAIYLNRATADDAQLLDLNHIKLSYATLLMAEDKDNPGTWVEYERIYSNENRIWVNYEDVPQVLLDCVVAAENPKFWSSGAPGSHITQQVVRLISKDNEDTVLRKARELYRAMWMERTYTKEQILEAYLNLVYLSPEASGIEAGAKHFFDISTQELSAAQSAALVSMISAPSANNPIQHPEDNKLKRDAILQKMFQQGYLTQQAFDSAVAESDAMRFDAVETAPQERQVYSWFTDTVIAEVLADLVESGYTQEEAAQLLYNGGLCIYLTVDTQIQAIVEDVAKNGYTRANGTIGFDRPVGGEADAQAAMVVMNYEGEILGIAGGLGEKKNSLEYTRATDMMRQPGTLMGPLGTYAPGIEHDIFTYSTGFLDAPLQGGWPSNSDGAGSGATVTVEEAIARSYNTVAVRALEKTGLNVAFDFLKIVFQLRGLQEEDNGYSALALGGMTYGVTPLEMCASYAIFGNDGTYYAPHSYSRIEDQSGEVLIDKTSTYHAAAISPETSMIMNRLLASVTDYGTGTNAVPKAENNPSDLPYVGKSGTTPDDRDFWWVGMNPYYVCAVWEGYDTPQNMTTIRPQPVQMLFREIMGRASKDLPEKEFPTAPGVVTAQYCTETGNLAGAGCPSKLGYYKENALPPRCTGH